MTSRRDPGLYTDNDVGSAGSTGRGLSPTDACLEAVKRAIAWTVEKRLQYPDGRPNFNVNFYAVNKKGEYGAAAIYSDSHYAVNVDGRGELKDSAYVFEKR